MKTNDYVRFLTQTVLEHLETPKEERIKRKIEKKEQKEPFMYKYFGTMPYFFKEGVRMAVNKRRKFRLKKGKFQIKNWIFEKNNENEGVRK